LYTRCFVSKKKCIYLILTDRANNEEKTSGFEQFYKCRFVIISGYWPVSYWILVSKSCKGLFCAVFWNGQNIWPLSLVEKLSLPPSMALRRSALLSFDPYTSDASMKCVLSFICGNTTRFHRVPHSYKRRSHATLLMYLRTSSGSADSCNSSTSPNVPFPCKKYCARRKQGRPVDCRWPVCTAGTSFLRCRPCNNRLSDLKCFTFEQKFSQYN